MCFGQWVGLVFAISLFVLLPACGGHNKPAPVSPYPVTITLNPSSEIGVSAELSSAANPAGTKRSL